MGQEKRLRMRRVILLIVILISLLASCCNKLTFRGNSFGDSSDEIKKSETGTPEEEYIESDNSTNLRYKDIEIGGYSGELVYNFNNNKLVEIFYYITSYGEILTNEDAYAKIIPEYMQYGTLVKDELLHNGTHKVLIKNGESGLVLAINRGNYCADFYQDFNKCKSLYDSLTGSVIIYLDNLKRQIDVLIYLPLKNIQ
jgi:hypothetical protein